ncbi:hypothetical protein CMI37_25025 [Candidatus Pacearchaeota archaeon]|nr:hypothetical protein [Candidatus Pacearchaeota archaeon]|tara:strand:- start:2883 stop:4049 length:1167 start_codon:yes stop_codon:yes gene_type:complete
MPHNKPKPKRKPIPTPAPFKQSPDLVETGQIPSSAPPFKQSRNLVKTGQVPSAAPFKQSKDLVKTGQVTSEPFKQSTDLVQTGQIPSLPFKRTLDLVKAGQIETKKNIQDFKAAFGKLTPEESRERLELALSILPVGKVIKAAKGAKIILRGNVFTKEVAVGGRNVKVGLTSVKRAAVRIVESAEWKILAAVTAAVQLAATTLTLVYGGRVFGKFLGMEEAAQTIGIATRDALIADNEEAYNIAAATRNEILANDPYWDTLSSYIPFANVEHGLRRFKKAATVAAEVYDMVAEARFSGETEEEKHARWRQEELDLVTAKSEEFNRLRKEQLEWERVHGYRIAPRINYTQEIKQTKIEIEGFYRQVAKTNADLNKTKAGNLSSLNFGLI